MKFKKQLSVLVAVVMMIGCMPGFVLATETDESRTPTEQTTAVQEEEPVETVEEEDEDSVEETVELIEDSDEYSVDPAFAATSVSITYLRRAWDPIQKIVTENIETRVIPSDHVGIPEDPTNLSGYYYIAEDQTINDRMSVKLGEGLTLILADGVTLKCPNGIEVPYSNSEYFAYLEILTQSDDSGTLIAGAPANCAGIGGSADSDCGMIFITGGTINASGNSGAGIGGASSHSAGYISIYGGYVTAEGNNGYAGIGGGRSCIANDISIYGGCITATGALAPAIGGDTSASDPIIIDIYGGSITANGGFGVPNIGACTGEFNGQVIISGGSITLPVRFAPYIGNDGRDQYSNTPLIINAGVSVLDGNTCVDCGDRVSICTAASTDSSNTLNIVPCQHSHFTNGVCDYCGFEMGDSAQFIGHAMRLTGEIGLQFYVQLPENSNADDYYMTFVGQGMDPSNPIGLTLDSGKSGVERAYYATVSLSSIQMAETFTPTLHGPNGFEIQGTPYSAQDYIVWGKSNTSIGTQAQDIIRALGDYGYFAQRYLSELRSWSLGTDYAAMTVRGSDEDYSQSYDEFRGWIAEHATSGIFNSNNGYFASAKFNLKFDSLVTMYVYLTPIDGVSIDTSLIRQGYSVEQLSDGRILITFPDLPIDALDNITHINYGDTPVVEISPLTYIYTAIGSSSSMSSDGKNMVCALFRLFTEVVHPEGNG